MRCWILERRLTAYLENAVSEGEKQHVQSHLEKCTDCSAKVESQRMVQTTLRSLPRLQAPSELTIQLRVMASKERLIDREPGSQLRRFKENLRLTLQNLMKPIALPAAGGFAAAVLLFGALMPTFALNRTSSADIPTALCTDPVLKTVAPIGFHYGDAEVDLQIDEQGRVVNYSIVSGACDQQELLRRSIENNLLFTTFTPATSFGVHTTSTIRLSFRSSRIDVKG